MKNGTVVRSTAGHDRGKLYVVIGAKDGFCLVADGKNKLLSSPKKKKAKHLENTGKYVELSAYNPIYDAHIRKELKGLGK